MLCMPSAVLPIRNAKNRIPNVYKKLETFSVVEPSDSLHTSRFSLKSDVDFRLVRMCDYHGRDDWDTVGYVCQCGIQLAFGPG